MVFPSNWKSSPVVTTFMIEQGLSFKSKRGCVRASKSRPSFWKDLTWISWAKTLTCIPTRKNMYITYYYHLYLFHFIFHME